MKLFFNNAIHCYTNIPAQINLDIVQQIIKFSRSAGLKMLKFVWLVGNIVDKCWTLVEWAVM